MQGDPIPSRLSKATQATQATMSLPRDSFSVLLISQDASGSSHILELLDEVSSVKFVVEQAAVLDKALPTLHQKSFDIILLDLASPDEVGLQDFTRLHDAIKVTPIVVMSNTDDEKLESELFKLGAQEFINKDKINANGIWRALRHACERHQSIMALAYERQTLVDLAEAVRHGQYDQIERVNQDMIASKLDQTLVKENSELISKIKHQNQQLQRMAHYDSLTEIPNRLSFDRTLAVTLAQAKRYDRQFAVLIIDLDRFKKVNDTLGHHVGDALLKSVAKRFLSRLREGDFVARLGGDEFGIILTEIKNEHGAGVVAQNLLNSLRLPFAIEDQVVEMGASIGIACYPGASQDADELMRHADFAMYSAKEAKGNCYHYSRAELHEAHLYRLKLEDGLRDAITKKELYLDYQPIVDMRTGKMNGMEVLLRWKHPQFGLVSPMEFIPIAEDTGLIVTLGEWVIYQACHQYAKWYKQGYRNLRVAINLSPRQLIEDGLASMITTTLEETALPSSNLELEVTEMAVMAKGDQASALLQHLHRLGMRSSMDDFGTGYSSLSRLRSLPISTLKIDRSFVNGIGKGSDDEVIISSIIALADQLGLDTVAEGVETKEQAEYLIANKCYRGQGFYFSRPMSVELMEGFLQANY